MDYFMGFHWWYILVGFILFIILFGKGKGGVVIERITADMEILDQRFDGCRPEAKYSIFKAGSPDHIVIEIKSLPVQAGEELKLQLNGKTLANVSVARDKEAEFDHWSDEDVDFPKIQDGDELVVRYRHDDVLKGTFRRI